MAGTVDKIKAKVEQVLHKDKSTDATGTHNTSTGIGSSGTHTGTTGHSTTGGLTGSSTTGTHGTTGHGTSGYSDPTGPHDSSIANKADPRVDSDRYGTAGNTSGAGGYGTGQYGEGHGTTGGLTGHSTTGGGLTGHSGTGGGLTGHSTTGGYGSTGRSDPTGPHDSHLANKADPRVDSDQYGTAGNTSGAGGYGTGQYGSTGHSTTGHGTHGTTGHSSSGGGLTSALGGVFSGSKHGSDPTGPHDTRTANKLDPRVDSDQYGSAGNTTGAGGYSSTTGGLGHSGTTGHTGTTGGIGHSSHSDPTGPHDSHLANKADPRVDSDRYGSSGNTTGYGSSTGGIGQSGTTGGLGHSGTTGGIGHSSYNDPTGPHDSHLANKADPRVDSDRYGSSGNTTGAGGYGTGQYGEGQHGTSGHTGELAHRPNEDGSLPKALTEDHSVAHPHSSLGDQHSTGTHGTEHKPSLKDKLNPKVDADGDGKAGFLK